MWVRGGKTYTHSRALAYAEREYREALNKLEETHGGR